MNRIRIDRGPGVGDPVHVWWSAGAAAPTEFVWRGRRYHVRVAEQAEGGSPKPVGKARRVRIRTTDGLACVLSQEAGGTWRMCRLVRSGGER
ncbi:MAG TPA: hypothetical protein VK449_06940 [Anaerolineales bacterium]|nr:hypothetical protein [Anaerolineales bacterium]